MKTCEFNVGENVIYDARMAGEKSRYSKTL